jgi:hypothetical protein
MRVTLDYELKGIRMEIVIFSVTELIWGGLRKTAVIPNHVRITLLLGIS